MLNFGHTRRGMLVLMTTEREKKETGVVVHLDEAYPEKHASVLLNIGNLLNELGDGTQVELVVHGPGLLAVIAEAPHSPKVSELLSRGVTVASCANTMRGMNISVADLIEGVHVVPSGVAELVRRQRQGWAYIRP